MIQPGIELKLPKTVTTDTQLKNNLVLMITNKEELYLDSEPVKLKQLGRSIEEKIVNYRDKILIIKADKDVKHGFVVKIMDIAKQSKVEKLAIATEKDKKN